jgi:anthrone oxygenase-like protein
MMIAVARFVNLVLAGLLAGNELGTRVAIHPSLERLSTPERIRAEQEVTRRYAAIMPFWMSSVIVSCLPVVALSRGTRAFLPTLAGTACFVGMLASTLIGNVPINNRVLEMSPQMDGEEFVELRERWDRLHSLRVALNVTGLGLLCAGALSRSKAHPNTSAR